MTIFILSNIASHYVLFVLPDQFINKSPQYIHTELFK